MPGKRRKRASNLLHERQKRINFANYVNDDNVNNVTPTVGLDGHPLNPLNSNWYCLYVHSCNENSGRDKPGTKQGINFRKRFRVSYLFYQGILAEVLITEDISPLIFFALFLYHFS